MAAYREKMNWYKGDYSQTTIGFVDWRLAGIALALNFPEVV